MRKEQKKKLPLSLGELIWYPLMCALGLWGLTYIVLGLIAKYANVRDADNELLKASNAIQKAFGLGFLYWGLIILAIAAVGAVVALLMFSRKADREYEKAQRRAAIRASQRKSTIDRAEIEQAQAEFKKEVEENRTTQAVKEEINEAEPEPVEVPASEENK